MPTTGIRAIVALLGILFPLHAAAAHLADGTPIKLKLLTVITSETSSKGDPLDFVVVSDVRSGDEVVVARGARVSGVVIEATRMTFGWTEESGRLAFRFIGVAVRGGQLVRLRASATKTPDDRVTVDRGGWHHRLQWAAAMDRFEAYVDGGYDIGGTVTKTSAMRGMLLWPPREHGGLQSASRLASDQTASGRRCSMQLSRGITRTSNPCTRSSASTAAANWGSDKVLRRIASAIVARTAFWADLMDSAASGV